MSAQQEFLTNAEKCCEIAALSGVEPHRDALLAMARQWRELAAEEERISDLVQAVDRLFTPEASKTKADEVRLQIGLVPRLEESLLSRMLTQKRKDSPSPRRARLSSPDRPDKDARRFPRWLSKRLYSVHEAAE